MGEIYPLGTAMMGEGHEELLYTMSGTITPGQSEREPRNAERTRYPAWNPDMMDGRGEATLQTDPAVRRHIIPMFKAERLG